MLRSAIVGARSAPARACAIASARASYRFHSTMVVEEDAYEDLRFSGLSGAQLVHESLVECGVDTVFGYSGGANLPVLDQFNDSPVRFVMNRSEQCCGHAAEGYARASGKVGVILTTSGPGLTNIITPLQDARGDSTPIVALSGQVPTSAVGTDAFQVVSAGTIPPPHSTGDIAWPHLARILGLKGRSGALHCIGLECLAVDLTRPCTKWSYQVRTVEEVRAVIHEAFHVASSGKPGPVHIDLPKDVMTSVLRGAAPALPLKPPPPTPSLQSLQAVARLLAIAKKPIFYVGQGAIEAGPELLQLAEKCDVPVTTTLHAMGVFSEFHSLSMHMLGMHGAAYANYAVQDADLIVAIGSRFDDRTTGVLNKYAPEAKKAHEEGRGGLIHFDIEPSQFGRVINPTVAVAGDAKLALQQLLPLAQKQKRPDWIERCASLKKQHPFCFTEASNGQIKTQTVIDALNTGFHVTRENLVVSTGVGNHQMMACQFLRWTTPRSIISSGSLGTMGFGLPAAIGAQVACPDKTVLLIDGDSSFNMTLNDLGTVKEHQLPIKMAIMNDGRQQMVHVWQKLFFDSRIVATDNVNPDYVKLAQSYDIEAYSCENIEDLPGMVEKFVNAKGPVLMDFKVVPDICLPMVAPGKGLDEMFLPGSISLHEEAPKMEGMAPS